MRRAGECRAIAVLGCAALILLGATGGARDDGGVSIPKIESKMERLGKLAPGEAESTEGRKAVIGPVAFVLFSGIEPAVPLAVRSSAERKPERIATRFEPLVRPRPGLRGSFPMEITEKPVVGDPGGSDGIDMMEATDIDGDGVEEMILVRRYSGIQVIGAARVLFGLQPGPGAESGRYQLICQRRVRLQDRVVIYILFELRPRCAGDAAAAGEPVRLLRVDRDGIAPVSLAGIPDRVFSFAALTDAQRAGVETIVVFGGDLKKGLVMTLHDPAGARRAGPFLPGVPYAQNFELASAPGSSWFAAVFPMQFETHLWFFDVAGDRATAKHFALNQKLHALRMIPHGPVPLLIIADATRGFALDDTLRFWSRESGRFTRSDKGSPLFAIEPGPGYEAIGLYPSPDGDACLVVHSRKKQVWRRTHAELLEAAGTFLPLEEFDDLKVLINPAATKEWENTRFDDEVAERLAWPIRHPESLHPARYRNLDGLRRWIAETDLNADTVFTLVRGEAPAFRFSAPGYINPWEISGFGDQGVQWRGKGDALTVVLAMKAAGPSGKEETAGFYTVRVMPR